MSRCLIALLAGLAYTAEPVKEMCARWTAEDARIATARRLEAVALRDSLHLAVVPLIIGDDLRQSEQRQNSERTRHNLSVLELTTLGPYLETAERITRHLLIVEEAAKTFPLGLTAKGP